MAILLLDDLIATPNPTALPRRVDFKQNVQSTLSAGEEATFTYSLAPDHDVFFEDGEGNRVKEVSREDRIPGDRHLLHNRIAVTLAPGGSPQSLVQITETVADRQGGQQQIVALLRIDP